MTNLTVYDKGWAEEVTARIKRSGEEFGELLFEAHEGKAWKFLGFKSWTEYVEAEFPFTRQHSYKLLDTERLNRRLEAGGSDVRVSVSESASLPKLSHHATVSEIETTVRESRAAPKPKGKKRRGPPSLTGYLASIGNAIESIEAAFENAGDDALDYLSFEDRRHFERIVSKSFEWSEAWSVRLSEPRKPVRIDEWSA
ncbi:MAG: hypothetical protein NUW22_16020 [Acidobacteria bacterium]|nr:hypothetical protein [Acidobacteriota bacterium]